MYQNIKGSALLASLIFAFVILVVISALAYNFRMDSLAIETIVNEKQSLHVDEGYFNNIPGTLDLTTDADQTIDNFRFVTTSNSVSARFDHQNTNTELYYGIPYVISYDISHEFFENNISKYVRGLVYNTLPGTLMNRYDEDYFPVNVPFVNTAGMSGTLASHKLGQEGRLQDLERGYIGYIYKNNNVLTISNAGGSFNVTVPNDLSLLSYTLAIGWDLQDGRWSIFLAIYDGNKVYTSSTTLRNLVAGQAQALQDLSNWQAIADLPGGYASNFPAYSPGTTYQVGDIVNSGGNLYSCIVNTRCSSNAQGDIAAYAPGTGSAWSLAWDLVESGTAPSEGGSSGSYSTYSPGTTYTVGQTVEKDGVLYSCKEASWCSTNIQTMLDAYAPGTGSAWSLAWTLEGPVDSGADDGGDDDGGAGSDPEGNIILVTWYHDFNNQVPKPLVLRKMPRDGNYDLDVYRATYNSSTKIFTAALSDTFTTGSANFSESYVHVVIPDTMFMLDVGVPLIFQGNNILDYNRLGTYLLGTSNSSTIRGTLAAESSQKPVIVKKNTTQMYIIFFNGDKYYKYLYSHSSEAPSLTVLDQPEPFPGEEIQKIIAKYGVIFVITNSYIYLMNPTDNSRISRLVATGSNYQIHRASDGRIYALDDGLNCTVGSSCGSRVYFETGCADYAGGCDALAELTNVDPYLNIVYKSLNS
ncbi:hypothetical protein IB633_01340 [Francisella philomiragia]|uniref:Chitin-binding type-3 domain-containing protein n=1 Tax=Francisella philomiragia subsp. philomiragia (strain ATCC 25017 / CCUG 19701 / FSC 153 / O\|nr:membrane protein [Francisella philomiragia]AJI47245.1 carbohydrate binding domain protein [Francisella philomiragia]AJI48779.1 carbohydrate binding domain protein [Francisella philomiragia]MBK2019804.1 hypothetical protein [Francisella philomiragia]MBK2029742.1 hypothetical protein [Francisella philomiragia]MBK2263678.1 hypothetical protein [Francisella philomiragia]